MGFFKRLLVFLIGLFGSAEKFVRQLVVALGEILGVPPIEDEAAVREFVRKVLVCLKYLSKWTPSRWDDKLILQAAAAIEDDAMWAVLYRVLLVVFRGETVAVALAGNRELYAAAARLDIDWPTVVKIVKLLVQILILGLRKGR